MIASNVGLLVIVKCLSLQQESKKKNFMSGALHLVSLGMTFAVSTTTLKNEWHFMLALFAI
jgi:hypothetical protein